MRLKTRVFTSASALPGVAVLIGMGLFSGQAIAAPFSGAAAANPHDYAQNTAGAISADMAVHFGQPNVQMEYGSLGSAAQSPQQQDTSRRSQRRSAPAANPQSSAPQQTARAMSQMAAQNQRNSQSQPQMPYPSRQAAPTAHAPIRAAQSARPVIPEESDFVPPAVRAYDAVGYAGIAANAGRGAIAAHPKLPAGSFAEVTSLTSGNTIVVAIAATAPLPSGQEIALSPAALQQLGLAEGSAVRVRWTSPPQTERAELRAGGPAPTRLATPAPLLKVLRDKLPTSGSEMIGRPGAEMPTPEMTASHGSGAPSQAAPSRLARANTESLPNIGEIQSASNRASPSPSSAGRGGFVVQAAAYSSKSNADKAASRVGGHVVKAGSVYRVRTGPYTSRGQAEAALAKVRAKGYRGARVFTNK